MNVLGYTELGSIRVIFDGEAGESTVPDDMESYYRFLIWDEWEMGMGPPDENGNRERINTIPPYVPSTLEPQPSAPLTARQLRLGLVINGIMLDQVESTIAGINDPQTRSVAQIEWEYASQFERAHPLIAKVAEALGLSDERVNEMWDAAKSL